MIFSVEEGTDVGRDGETPVVENYGIPAPYEFTGKIVKVTIDLKEIMKADEAEGNRHRAESAQNKAISD